MIEKKKKWKLADFDYLLPEKYKNYVELTQERMDELNKFFPFMQ